MKIVKVIGGLGNQMFQYALSLGLEKKFPGERILLDLNHFKYYSAHNGFELARVFRAARYKKASLAELLMVTNPYVSHRLSLMTKLLPRRSTVCKEQDGFPVDGTVLARKGNRYFDGFWQHIEYFAHAAPEVRAAFAFPTAEGRNKALIETIASTESVSVHLRRGDYLSLNLYNNICTFDYYRRAVEYAKSALGDDLLFCIFSDDIDWCRENLQREVSLGGKIVYVDWNKGADSFRDMQLMSMCKHNIIANSSFSWWGAWLNANPGKLVLAPDKWLNYDGFNDPVPASWVKIKTI